jgi:hypothetical protein
MSYLVRYIRSNVRYKEDIGSFFGNNIVMKTKPLEGSPCVSKTLAKQIDDFGM